MSVVSFLERDRVLTLWRQLSLQQQGCYLRLMECAVRANLITAESDVRNFGKSLIFLDGDDDREGV